jgi:hypothetical protein
MWIGLCDTNSVARLPTGKPIALREPPSGFARPSKHVSMDQMNPDLQSCDWLPVATSTA